MGFQDRDYVRGFGYNDGGYLPRRGEMMMVTKIIIINAVLFLINGLLLDGKLFDLMKVYGWTLATPLYWWQCLTYGFAHSPNDLWHIGGNMLSLFFLGYAVEERLGAWEFLRFYLVTIVFGGIVYSALNLGIPQNSCLGASGGVTGVVMLFILWYPHRTLLLWGVMPIPAWVIGAFIVGTEVMGLLGSGQNDIAYAVHLVGIAAAFSYQQWRSRFGNLGDLPRLFTRKNRGGWMKKSVPKKPTIRVYDPLDDDDDAWLERRVNEILKKYAECGEAGLSDEERSILKRASEQYREKYKSNA